MSEKIVFNSRIWAWREWVWLCFSFSHVTTITHTHTCKHSVKTHSAHPQPHSVSQTRLLFHSWHPLPSLKNTVHLLFPLFSPPLLGFHVHALFSLLAGGQVGPGPRWSIAMSFNKQLNSSTHATENDLHRHLHYKKCPTKFFSFQLVWIRIDCSCMWISLYISAKTSTTNIEEHMI